MEANRQPSCTTMFARFIARGVRAFVFYVQLRFTFIGVACQEALSQSITNINEKYFKNVLVDCNQVGLNKK